MRLLVFVFLLVLYFFQIETFSLEAPMNASVMPVRFYYITMSDKLSEGIDFTNETGAVENVQYPLLSGSYDNSAIWNYNKTDKKTEYWIYFYGQEVSIDICHGATGHLCSNEGCSGPDNVQIDISSIGWTKSTTNDASSPPAAPYATPMVIGYDGVNRIGESMEPNTTAYVRYWFDVPVNVPALDYSTVYQIKAVLAGESCA